MLFHPQFHIGDKYGSRVDNQLIINTMEILDNMNATQNSLWTKTNGILTCISIAVAIVIACWTNKEKKIILNVERTNDILLTQTFNVDGLTYEYIYRDSIPVSNLRQTTFVVTNIGDEVMYGKGFSEPSIRGASIPLRIEGDGKVLSVTITNENNGCVLMGTNQLQIMQWRPNEYIELSVLSDSPKPMQLLISDREIKNAKVMYSFYTPDPVVKKDKYIDYISSRITNILRWVYVCFITIMWLLSIVPTMQQYRNMGNRVAKVTFSIFMLIFVVITIAPILWMF